MLFPAPSLDSEEEPSEKIKALAMVAGLSKIGLDAMNVGDLDFAGGLKFLRRLQASANFPMLSANIVDPDGNPIFDASTIISRGGIRIGIVGATGPVLWENHEVKLTPVVPALQVAVAAVSDSVDIVILLYHGNSEELREISDAGLAIDLAFQSHYGNMEADFGDYAFPVATMGKQGKFMTHVEIILNEAGVELTDLTNPNRAISYADRTIQMLGRNQPSDKTLEEIYADKPKILERLESLRSRKADAEAEIASAVNTIELTHAELGPDMKDTPEIMAITEEALAAMLATIRSPGEEGEN